MTQKSTSSMIELLLKLVKRSGILLKSNINSYHQIDFKGSASNIVTEMDKAVESLFIKGITKYFPEHQIMSEEASSLKVYECPVIPIKKGYRWIIDPLDGTTNYAHGFPHFCVSAAIEKDKQVILGAVYNPMLNELFLAKKGEGAWLNDKPIKVSNTRSMELALLATGFPYDFKTNRINNIDHFFNLSNESRAIRRAGSAALDLCDVACGRFDGFWEMSLQAWDIAAGALIVNEAGGKCSGFDGKRASIYERKIVASNGKIHKKIVEILQKGRH